MKSFIRNQQGSSDVAGLVHVALFLVVLVGYSCGFQTSMRKSFRQTFELEAPVTYQDVASARPLVRLRLVSLSQDYLSARQAANEVKAQRDRLWTQEAKSSEAVIGAMDVGVKLKEVLQRANQTEDALNKALKAASWAGFHPEVDAIRRLVIR